MNPYRHSNSRRPTTTLSYRCEGCYQRYYFQITEEFEGKTLVESGQNCDAWMAKQGWVKRYFSPNVSAWFCCEDCAYRSPRSLEIASYWI